MFWIFKKQLLFEKFAKNNKDKELVAACSIIKSLINALEWAKKQSKELEFMESDFAVFEILLYSIWEIPTYCGKDNIEYWKVIISTFTDQYILISSEVFNLPVSEVAKIYQERCKVYSEWFDTAVIWVNSLEMSVAFELAFIREGYTNKRLSYKLINKDFVANNLLVYTESAALLLQLFMPLAITHKSLADIYSYSLSHKS